MNYADFDGDGYPDHVRDAFGNWRAFDPATGQLLQSSLPAAPSGAVSSSGVAPDSSGGGRQGVRPQPSAYLPAPPRTFGSGERTIPTYRNGQRHPAHGGQPLTPGGYYRGPEGSQGDSRQQVTNPDTGASAGPFRVQSPRSAMSDRMSQRTGTGGGGGGSLAKTLIGQMRAKLEGKLSGQSTSYGSYDSNYQPYEPEEPRMRGFARKIDPEQAMGLYYRPTALIPRVAKGFVNAGDPNYQWMSELPMRELTMLMGGRKIAAPDVDEYGNLTKKDTSLSDYTNQLAKQWENTLLENEWFDYDQMARNMIRAKPNSALGAQFKGNPVGDQINAFLGNANAVFSTTTDPRFVSGKMAYANALADQFGGKYLNKNPKRTPSIARKMGRDLFY